jgi:hypothetical protein
MTPPAAELCEIAQVCGAAYRIAAIKHRACPATAMRQAEQLWHVSWPLKLTDEHVPTRPSFYLIAAFQHLVASAA